MTTDNDLLFKPLPRPSDATLHKYGLSYNEWLALYWEQKGKCAICHNNFKPGSRINVDHQHVKGWNKMAPEQRKGYIRGLLCFTCNRFMVMRGVTSTKLWNAWMYMRNFEVRVRAESTPAPTPEREYPQPPRARARRK